MSEHPIQGLMQTAMESLKSMVDVNTVVGDAVETKTGAVIIPVSRVSFGFAAGGSQWPNGGRDSLPFGGGSGAGISVQPVGFLVVSPDHVRLLPVGDRGALERLVDMTPEVLDRLQGVLGPKPQPRPRSAEPAPEGDGATFVAAPEAEPAFGGTPRHD